jgi:hypothetical protein
MAKFPDLADQIKDVQTVDQTFGLNFQLFSNDSTDDIFIYEFFHKKTNSVKEGRYILYINDDIVIMDQGLPYRDIPIYRVSAGEILGTPYAYTPMFDLYPLQEAINSTYSTILTNQNATGVTNFYVPRGADIVINSLAGGLNVIEANAKPEALNLTNTPKEIFEFLQLLIASQETLSGISSVTRGNPEASLRSGSALALVQAMSLQFISGLQASYIKLIEDTGTSLINMLKDYAKSPKLIALVGKYNRTFLKEFTGEDLDAINRVIVDVGNPLSRSLAGRVQMAEQMMQMGVIKNPQQYFQVLNTGRLDALFEGDMSNLLNIKKENEALMTGESVRALDTDSHRLHILEHRSVLDDPELRKDPQIVAAVKEHIQEHVYLLRIIDPDLLTLLGEQPLTPLDQISNGGPVNIPENQGSPSQLQQPPAQQTANQQVTASQQGQVLPSLPTPAPPFESLPILPGGQ